MTIILEAIYDTTSNCNDESNINLNHEKHLEMVSNLNLELTKMIIKFNTCLDHLKTCYIVLKVAPNCPLGKTPNREPLKT